MNKLMTILFAILLINSNAATIFASEDELENHESVKDIIVQKDMQTQHISTTEMTNENRSLT